MEQYSLNGDAVINLLAFWSARLGVGGVTNNADSACAVGFVAEELRGEEYVADLSSSVAFTEGVEVGIRAAAAVLSDPLGDPRERLRAAFTT